MEGGQIMQVMMCKNCLAPINPHLDHCEYCGGYFEKPPEETTTYDLYDGRIMTPNEMRATIGLDPFTDEIIPLEPGCEYTFDECKQKNIIKKPQKTKKKLFGFGR